MLVASNIFLPRKRNKHFCWDKYLLRQTKTKQKQNKQKSFVATKVSLSSQNTSLVVTKLFCGEKQFCHDKGFVATSILLLGQMRCFVTTKMILVAAPANDSVTGPAARSSFQVQGEAGDCQGETLTLE